jgi:hypothetical protein
MILNQKSWELVKFGDFIVGDRPLVIAGIIYPPGEAFPRLDNEKSLFGLYEVNAITEAPKKLKPKIRKK